MLRRFVNREAIAAGYFAWGCFSKFPDPWPKAHARCTVPATSARKAAGIDPLKIAHELWKDAGSEFQGAVRG